MNHTPLPILQTERLTLRALNPEDETAIYELRTDPEVNKYLDRKLCTHLKEASIFIEKINKSIAESNTFYWGIAFTGSKEVLGTICLFDFSSIENSYEIGFELRSKYQKQGIMFEATQKIVDFTFNHLKATKIKAFTHLKNTSSIQLLEKINFKEITTTSKDNNELKGFVRHSNTH